MVGLVTIHFCMPESAVQFFGAESQTVSERWSIYHLRATSICNLNRYLREHKTGQIMLHIRLHHALMLSMLTTRTTDLLKMEGERKIL